MFPILRCADVVVKYTNYFNYIFQRMEVFRVTYSIFEYHYIVNIIFVNVFLFNSDWVTGISCQ